MDDDKVGLNFVHVRCRRLIATVSRTYWLVWGLFKLNVYNSNQNGVNFLKSILNVKHGTKNFPFIS